MHGRMSRIAANVAVRDVAPHSLGDHALVRGGFLHGHHHQGHRRLVEQVRQVGRVALRYAAADQRMAERAGRHLLDVAHAGVLRRHPQAPLPSARCLARRIEVQPQHGQHLRDPVESQIAQSARFQTNQCLPRKPAQLRKPGLRQSQRLAPLADDGAQVGEVHSLVRRIVEYFGHSSASGPHPPGARQRRRRPLAAHSPDKHARCRATAGDRVHRSVDGASLQRLRFAPATSSGALVRSAALSADQERSRTPRQTPGHAVHPPRPPAAPRAG
jgi:hypothetical protein